MGTHKIEFIFISVRWKLVDDLLEVVLVLTFFICHKVLVPILKFFGGNSLSFRFVSLLCRAAPRHMLRFSVDAQGSRAWIAVRSMSLLISNFKNSFRIIHEWSLNPKIDFIGTFFSWRRGCAPKAWVNINLLDYNFISKKLQNGQDASTVTNKLTNFNSNIYWHRVTIFYWAYLRGRQIPAIMDQAVVFLVANLLAFFGLQPTHISSWRSNQPEIWNR